MTKKRAGGTILNIIETNKNVQQTMAELRELFKKWFIEDWEVFPHDAGAGYTVRFLRGKTWTEVGSHIQPTKPQNLRVCYWVVHNLKTWGERGVTGQAQGVQFVGALVRTGKDAEEESYEEACAVMGVEPDTSFEEVKRVYNVKVQFAHPDKEGGSPERFKRIQRAYEYIAKVKGQRP